MSLKDLFTIITLYTLFIWIKVFSFGLKLENMNRMVENLISIPLWIILWLPTIVHRSMVKESYRVKYLKKATYEELKQKMLSTKWKYDPSFPYSLFDASDYNANYFHAGIFEFNGVGYLLTPYGWLMANLLQRKIRKYAINYTASKPYIN